MVSENLGKAVITVKGKVRTGPRTPASMSSVVSPKSQCSRDEVLSHVGLLRPLVPTLRLLLVGAWPQLGLFLNVQRFILILQLKAQCTTPGAGI